MASIDLLEAAVSVVRELQKRFTQEEIVAILDASRFAVMTSIEKGNSQDLRDMFLHESQDPDEHEIARWEDDGGAVNGR